MSTGLPAEYLAKKLSIEMIKDLILTYETMLLVTLSVRSSMSAVSPVVCGFSEK